MSRAKIRVVGVRNTTDKLNNKIRVLVTAPAESEEVCKQCKKEPKVHGSSRCEKCSNQYKVQKLNDARLSRKIEQASKIKNNQ